MPGKEGGTVHANILHSVTVTGESKVREYFKYSHIDDPNRVSRSEKDGDGVCFKKLATTTKQINKLWKDEIVTATSTAKGDIKSLLTIDSIIEQITKLRELDHDVKIPETPKRSKANHVEYVTFLSKQRQKVFRRKPILKDELINAINSKYKEQETSTQAQRAELLQHKLYSLSASICADERYNQQYDLLAAPTSNM